jgi:hypothetical protein
LIDVLRAHPGPDLALDQIQKVGCQTAGGPHSLRIAHFGFLAPPIVIAGFLRSAFVEDPHQRSSLTAMQAVTHNVAQLGATR